MEEPGPAPTVAKRRPEPWVYAVRWYYKKTFLIKTENLKNEGSGRWGAIRPVDECFAPTVAERRPEPWVQVTLRYYKKKPLIKSEVSFYNAEDGT